jgi:hypothetical protein
VGTTKRVYVLFDLVSSPFLVRRLSVRSVTRRLSESVSASVSAATAAATATADAAPVHIRAAAGADWLRWRARQRGDGKPVRCRRWPVRIPPDDHRLLCRDDD